MKKFLIVWAMAVVAALPAGAQNVLEESKTTDNWYVGVSGAVFTKTTHNGKLFYNLNPAAGVRLGRYWTPVAGWAVEGVVYFNDRQFQGSSNNKGIRAWDVNLLGTLNLSNWFGGYQGKPRLFEVVALAGLGANVVVKPYGNVKKSGIDSKLGLDLTLNLGRSRAWQVYLEPAINYALTRDVDRIHFNVNQSALQLMMGINYKLGNTNGTHNFKTARLRSQTEIDELNAKINLLREEVDTKDLRIASDIHRISELEDSLDAARKVKPTVINKVTKVTNVVSNNVLQPTVIFGQGKSAVDAAQMASVAMIAKYMKNHPEAKILIKGYASPEGNPELNQRLSEARATAVKNVLVGRYGIAESRLSIQGMGATDELFDEVDFNRVATFTDTSK